MQWTVGEAGNFRKFELQRSATGSGNFATITTVYYSNGQSSYSYTDDNVSASGYYRLLLLDNDGTITYSSVIFIAANGTMQRLKVSPNPVIAGGTVNITLAGYTGVVSGLLYEGSGRLVITSKLTNGNNKISTASLAKGIYQLVVQGANGNARTEKIVVQ